MKMYYDSRNIFYAFQWFKKGDANHLGEFTAWNVKNRNICFNEYPRTLFRIQNKVKKKDLIETQYIGYHSALIPGCWILLEHLHENDILSGRPPYVRVIDEECFNRFYIEHFT